MKIKMKLKAKFILTGFFVFLSMDTYATLETEISQVGPHYPIITFEKNENSQNIMVIYTKLDQNCHPVLVAEASKQPAFDFYWLMNGKDYKPVNSLIKSGIRERLAIQKGKPSSANKFSVFINDLKEMNTDITDPRLTVEGLKTTRGCDVQGTMRLGPSDQNQLILLSTIYTESKKTLLPPFRKLLSVTLIGTNVATHAAVKRTYKGK